MWIHLRSTAHHLLLNRPDMCWVLMLRKHLLIQDMPRFTSAAWVLEMYRSQTCAHEKLGIIGLNESQRMAVQSWAVPFKSVIGGAPGITHSFFFSESVAGTGKTTTVVDILRSIIYTKHIILKHPNVWWRCLRITVKHSHDFEAPFSCNVNLQPIAVDNVLEQFVKINEEDKLLRDEQILRVATD